MKILYIIPTYKPSTLYGGVTEVVGHLAESLAQIGHDVTVYTTNGNGEDNLDVETAKEVILDGVKVFFFKRYTGDHSHLSPAFWFKILLNVKRFDVVHLHSWWSPSIVVAAGICKLRGVKPVFSPHGMFCDYILYGRNRWKKKVLHFFSRPFLLNSFLHVSTEMEWLESQKFIKADWEGVIISNPVKVNNERPEFTRELNDVFTIGFLSRIDPKKGLDILIKALSNVDFNYRLKIAGGGDAEYVQYLTSVAVKCGNSDKIDWVGWKFKKEKFAFFSAIDLFALVSLNENFAVVVIESLSVGTPVLLSKQVGLARYVEEKQLGWATEIDDLNKVARQLERIYEHHETRERINRLAPEIIRRDFDSQVIVEKYIGYYNSLIEPKQEIFYLNPIKSDVN